MNEIIEPNSIIVELTIAIETLKNSSRKERWEPMMDLIANGWSKLRSTFLAGVSKSMIYYRHREGKTKYGADLEKRISSIVEESPAYGTSRVMVMIHWHGIITGRAPYGNTCASRTSYPQERRFKGNKSRGTLMWNDSPSCERWISPGHTLTARYGYIPLHTWISAPGRLRDTLVQGCLYSRDEPSCWQRHTGFIPWYER